MPEPQNQVLTHGSYDAQAVAHMLEEGDLRLALCASMRLLSSCLLENPRSQGFDQACTMVRNMDIAADWPFGEKSDLVQVAGLLAEGTGEGEEELLRDYTMLFRGPAKLPAPPWGSVYMDRDQVMYGWTWVQLRAWLRAHAIEASYEDNDPEDNFARMLSLAATVAEQRPELLAELLGDHLLCWSDHFLELLAQAPKSSTYKAFALLARTTLADIQQVLCIEPAQRRFYR